jgi:hypothetical protein
MDQRRDPATMPPWFGNTEGGALLLALQAEGHLSAAQVGRILDLHRQEPTPEQVYAEAFFLKGKTVGQLRAAKAGVRLQVLEGTSHDGASYDAASSHVQSKIASVVEPPVPAQQKVSLSERIERIGSISAALLSTTEDHLEAVEAVLSLGPRPGPARR